MLLFAIAHAWMPPWRRYDNFKIDYTHWLSHQPISLRFTHLSLYTFAQHDFFTHSTNVLNGFTTIFTASLNLRPLTSALSTLSLVILDDVKVRSRPGPMDPMCRLIWLSMITPRHITSLANFTWSFTVLLFVLFLVVRYRGARPSFHQQLTLALLLFVSIRRGVY